MTNIVRNILIANIVMFALTYIIPLLIQGLILYPDSNFNPIQLVTYMFLHGSIIHILFNMIGLVVFGPELERTYGSDTFLSVYIFSGIISGATHLMFMNSPVVGASGSIWSLMVIYALNKPNQIFYVYFIIPAKIKYIVGLFLIFEVYSALFVNDSVSHFGHLGGAVSGFIFYMLNKYKNE